MTIKPLATTTTDEEALAPIVVDLGKTKRSQVKKLKNGQGKLMEDVQEVLDQVRASLGDKARGVQLVPVVMVYRKKSKRRSVGVLGF